jgi:preprotein translocase subunit SecE
MSLAHKEDGKKWIQTTVALTCMIVGYVLMSFFETLSEWFELESKIGSYTAISQAVSVLIALGVFTYIMRTPKTANFLHDVYQEAIKVIWPDKNDTVKHTIIIMIGVTIMGFILGVFDIGASWLLSLIA